MSDRLAAKICASVLGVALAATAAPAQEHVRLMPQFGNNGVLAVAFSPQGNLIATGGMNPTVLLWDPLTEKEVAVLEGHRDPITSIAFSPDGRYLVAGSWDTAALLWDVATGKLLRQFVHKSEVNAVAFSPDGRYVLTGSWDNTAGLWDIETGKEIQTFQGHTEGVLAVAFSPDGSYVLTGGADNTARLWDAATGKQIRSFIGHTGTVESVAFSPDGRYAVTGAGHTMGKITDKTARLWDVATGQQIRSFEGHTSAVRSVAFSPDGLYILTASEDDTARLWDANSGQQIRSFTGHTRGVISAVFSLDGSIVLTGSYDNTAKIWKSGDGQQIGSLEGHTAIAGRIAQSPDARYLLQAAWHTARVWDVTTGQQARPFTGSSHGFGATAFSPDGRYVLAGSANNAAQLWDFATRQLLRTFSGHTQGVDALAFSPDGRLAVTTSWDETARVWDVASGQSILTLAGHSSDVDSAAFSPNGRELLTASMDNTARLWDASTGQLIRSFVGHTDSIFCAVFSPDGRSVLTGSADSSAQLWDTATAKPIRKFSGPFGWVSSVAFTRDGAQVLTGSKDGVIRLWDAASGELLRSFEGHTGSVNSLVITPDGRFLFSGSEDTTTRLWDFTTGKELAVLLSFDNGGWAVTDPEGRYDANDPDSTPGLVWVSDSRRVIELQQLKDNYYTPNLLARILKGERLPEVKGLDIVPAPPLVAVASPYRAETKRLLLNIEDQGGGVGRLVVSVNDRKVAALEHPLAARAACKSKCEVTVDLSAATLQPGQNTITAYAFDRGNQIRSHQAVASFSVAAKTRGLSPEPGDSMSAGYKPQFYGIVVGTSRFANHAMDLMYPAHDAESIMTGLMIGAGNLFGNENVHLRLLTTDAKDEKDQPTKANIAAAFADVTQKAKPTDVWLVYLSGHGVSFGSEKDSYYYLTADARSLEIENNPALRGLSTVSSAELRKWLGAKNMPLKEVLILDTCAAGAANQELLKLVEKRDVPPDQRRAVEFLKDATGTVILMGAAADKVSYEASKYGQGLLTYALLEGMRGRSVADGGQLNVTRWFQNASEEVPLLAEAIGGIQKPQIAAPNVVGFPVAMLDAADEARIPIAVIKPEMLHLTCHDENDEDPLGLAAAVRAELREISHPSVRGQAEPPIVYLDELTEGPSGTLMPKIVYQVDAGVVSLRLRIDRNGKTIEEDHLNLNSADKGALASAVAARLVELAAKVPAEDAKQ